MQCRRKGCKNEALPGKEYCGVKCSREDSKDRFKQYTGIDITKKKEKKKVKKMKKTNSYGKLYCEHYDSAYYNCVNCMEQAVFKYKSCYKEAKR